MLKDMKPIRGIQVGDLVRHTDEVLGYPSIWASSTGIVIGLSAPTNADICPYPTIYWSDGEIGTAHRQFLEIVSESG